MKIKYYGTGDGYGIPEPLCSCRLCSYARAHGGRDIRTRSQATVGSVMVDCSVDMPLHTVMYGLDMRDWRHILFTHDHNDHFDLGQFMSRFTDEETWHLYLPLAMYDDVKAQVDKVASAPQKNPPRRVPVLHRVTPYEPFMISETKITALKSNHNPHAVIYLIEEAGKAVLWVHDSGLLTEDAKAYLAAHPVHLDYVTMDCTLGRGSHFTPTHMDILECAETADTLRGIGLADGSTRFALSHIGHLIDRTHAELTREAEEFGFEVAYDTMEVEI